MARKERFTDQLRRAVEASDKTRYRISKDTGIDEGNLSRFVKRGAGLSADNIDKLCEYLGLRLVAETRPERKQGTKKTR